MTVRTNRAREKFLKVLRETCNVSEAARIVNMSRNAAYMWRADDPDFAAAWAEAEQAAADKLEREAWRRAVEGTDKPVTFQGVIRSTYKEYSDRMLELLLKAHRPEKFKERVATEHTGADGGPIQHEDVGSAREVVAERLGELAARSAEKPQDTKH